MVSFSFLFALLNWLLFVRVVGNVRTKLSLIFSFMFETAAGLLETLVMCRRHSVDQRGFVKREKHQIKNIAAK